MVNPEHGEGTYWYFDLDTTMAVAVFDMTFREDTHFNAAAPNFFCFGCYGQNMIPYFSPLLNVEEGWERGTLLGYAWQNSVYSTTARKDRPLRATSISLMPQAATEIAHELGVSPMALTTGISCLNGSQQIPSLLNLFDEIRTVKPCAAVARAYYRSKIVEACTLVVDWQLRFLTGNATRIRATDRTAFNLACAYVRDNLGEPITLERLCRTACVSASKLTGLFKEIEGMTPMGYVRERRMERACEMLETTDEPLARISSAVGFARQGSFSEAFRDRFGMTPHAYRKLKR